MKIRKSGIRRRYRELMEQTHFTFPRKTLIHHKIGWYLDGSAAARPAFGVYSMACFAEYILHFARFGRRGQSAYMKDAAKFYASTRAALQNTLSTYPIGERLSEHAVESLRRLVYRLVAEANDTYDKVMKSGTRADCPCCGNAHGLSVDDARLLEAILYEQSRNGTIPPTSELYRPEPLTP